MPRLLLVLFPIIVLVFAVFACNGDAGPTTSPTAEPTPTPMPSRISQVADESQFLTPYAEKVKIRHPCTFDAATGLVDCGENGLYEPNPPPDENAECFILLVKEELIAVTCSIQEPLTVTYYAIQ